MKCLELLFPKAESTKTSLILLASRPCVRIDICEPRTRQVTALLRNSCTLSCTLRSEWWGCCWLEYLRWVSVWFGFRFWFPHTFSTLANDFHHDSCLHNCVWRIYQCRWITFPLSYHLRSFMVCWCWQVLSWWHHQEQDKPW